MENPISKQDRQIQENPVQDGVYIERTTGLEPAVSTLARLRFTN